MLLLQHFNFHFWGDEIGQSEEETYEEIKANRNKMVEARWIRR